MLNDVADSCHTRNVLPLSFTLALPLSTDTSQTLNFNRVFWLKAKDGSQPLTAQRYFELSLKIQELISDFCSNELISD